MAYKTILTIITDTDLVNSALDSAVTLAQREDAHLDVLCLGVDRTQTGYYYAGANAFIQQETLQKAQEDATRIEAGVKTRLERDSLKWSAEAAVAQIAGLSHLVAQRARFSDIVVMPRPYGEHRGIEDEAAVEAVMFDGQAPLLVMPEDANAAVIGRKIIIAWNQSAEALSAIRRALPLLQAAESVNIAVIDPPQHGPDRSDPGGALSQMLSRHGVRTEISVLAKTMPRVADVLRRHAQDIEADMIVMGAYGHSRFREALLGGATRHMLENTEVPVLMAH
ncbi:universal stress protein family protein [Rhodovulum imhoffii]|uniref:Universal stress protein family protein n=1 Tax=Rhodovulum imhoffii TaxID=365340 RepID=A0A2T5BPF3_9RHOB|nr:universal stress protein [Rhodovulum imhoffii]MBK5932630.1 universal stress protein [Rhodovulum imhoffii]PTN00916.1 universal stress protein family protein [Rhodovulum imhoffii]